jgi:uncharacterized protein with NRDE domain
MCLLAVAWQSRPGFALVFAGNRDEFHARPATPADWWQDAPHVLGGRDLAAGGSWLALARGGRFAVVTNHRDLRVATPAGAPSRGALVKDFVAGDAAPEDFVAALMPEAGRYAGFNLLVGRLAGERASLWYASNRAAPRALAPGRYLLSNSTLDVPWPKVEALRARFDAALAGTPDEAALFAALADRATHADEALPDTGLDRARERALSAAHIVTPGYGTRAATVIAVDAGGAARFVERSFGPDGAQVGERRHAFALGEGR